MTYPVFSGGRVVAMVDPRESMVCSPVQMRLALLAAGRLSDVEAIAATDPAAQQVWEYALTITRSSPFIDALKGDAFTDAEIDALFIAAMEINT